MKKSEIEEFVKKHTIEFEKELWEKEKRVIGCPKFSFERTAAINLQRKRSFDQNAVIQQKIEELAEFYL